MMDYDLNGKTISVHINRIKMQYLSPVQKWVDRFEVVLIVYAGFSFGRGLIDSMTLHPLECSRFRYSLASGSSGALHKGKAVQCLFKIRYYIFSQIVHFIDMTVALLVLWFSSVTDGSLLSLFDRVCMIRSINLNRL